MAALVAIIVIGGGIYLWETQRDPLSDGVDDKHLREESRALAKTQAQTHTAEGAQKLGTEFNKTVQYHGEGVKRDLEAIKEGIESKIKSGRICDSERGCVGGGAIKTRPGNDTTPAPLPRIDTSNSNSTGNLLRPQTVIDEGHVDLSLSTKRLASTEAQIMDHSAPPPHFDLSSAVETERLPTIVGSGH